MIEGFVSDAVILRWNAEKWPLGPGEDLKFTLVYEGQLLAGSKTKTRADHKHAIRRQLHPQLKRLWEMKLPHWINDSRKSRFAGSWFGYGTPFIKTVGDNFSRCGYRFVPLVMEEFTLACKLDILFLRRDWGVGKIIQGGDLDNRLKTLFDALRIPNDCSELAGALPGQGEDPFYCLLQDDNLITEVRVRTGTLLIPETEEEGQGTVKLVIAVTLKPLQLGEHNADFA